MERGQVPASLNSCTFTICCLVGWRWNTATSPTPRLLMYTHCLDTDNNFLAQASSDLSAWIYQLGYVSLDLSHLLGWTMISAAAVWLTLTTASSVTLLRFPVLTSRLNSWTNQRSVSRSRDQL